MSFIRFAEDAEPLKIRSINDHFFDISKGVYTDREAVNKFGYNSAVPNGSYADIWAYGATDPTYNWPTTTESFRVAAGGNAADTANGAGARKIKIVYLDGNGNEQEEELVLAGSSASAATTGTGRRVIRAWVSETGTYGGANTGNILIENTSTNAVLAFIAAGISTTQLSMYTIPAGYTGYLLGVGIDVAAGANKDADVRMWTRENAYTTTAPYGAACIVHQWASVQGENDVLFTSPLVFPALSDIWFDARGNGAITAVDCHYSIVIVQN